LQEFNVNLVRAVVAEFFAATWFLFYNITVIQYSSGLVPTGTVLDSARLLLIALNFGLSIFVLVYIIFEVSGGHINPAITFSLMLGKRVSAVRALLYIIAQVSVHTQLHLSYTQLVFVALGWCSC
jgi:aquaporin PIP